MPKTTGPLFSLSASGSLAKTITYATWRGIRYARQRVQPKPTFQAGQVSARAVFRYLSRVWSFLPAPWHTAWIDAAKGRPLTHRNLLVQMNAKQLKDDTAITFMTLSPGDGASPMPTGQAATQAGDDLSCAFDAPTPPASWTFVGCHVLALTALDPTTDDWDDFIFSAPASAISPIVLVGAAAAAGDRMVFFMHQWTDDLGATRYSASAGDGVTTA